MLRAMMDEGPQSRRNAITLAARDPLDAGRPCIVQISYERMQAVAKRGMGHAKEAGLIVPFVLQHPTAIFEGLRRDDDEDRFGYGWRCYCAVPPWSFRTDGREANPYPNQVYLVFVNDEHVAYNWRWEHADPSDPKLPQGFATRFRTRLL